MRGLTIQQPWAWCVVHGGKNVENRGSNWDYRGPIAIHAGARWSERGETDRRVRRAKRHGDASWPMQRGDFPTRSIVGIASLVDCHPDTGRCCRPWGESSYAEWRGGTITEVHHLVLDDVRPLVEPLRHRGNLGLWTVPPHIVEQVMEMAVEGSKHG